MRSAGDNVPRGAPAGSSGASVAIDADVPVAGDDEITNWDPGFGVHNATRRAKGMNGTKPSRRRFLQLSSATLAQLALSSAQPSTVLAAEHGAARAAKPATRQGELAFASTREFARKIRHREISSQEAIECCLARIEEVNPWLNAVVTLNAESALHEARAADTALARGRLRGPLHGVPMTVKDALDTAGVVSAWGTPSRAQFVPKVDATVVARAKAAGAILLGKTNTPELTFSFETNSPVHGPTNNPFDIERSAGGSSGGAAAIVAAGGSPFDLASDTGGSVRLPAHFCGVAGIRPTSGRVPRTGHAVPPGGLLDSLCQIGPIARYVEDLAYLLPIIAGPDNVDPAIVPMPLGEPGRIRLQGLRASFHVSNGIREPTNQTRQVVATVVKTLQQKGVEFEERRPPGIEESFTLFSALFNWDAGAWFRLLRERGSPGDAPQSHTAPDAGMIRPASLLRLFERWDRFRSRMLGFMTPYDILVCPVNAYPALPHGKALDELEAFSYTMTYSLTGWPAVVVRAGTSPEGLPIGVQIVAKPWREDTALAAAAYIERILGGWKRPPI